MKYQIIKVINEVTDFEDACVLAGIGRHPAFDELPGELFWSAAKQAGVLAVPEPGDDEIAEPVIELVGVYDCGRLVEENYDDPKKPMICANCNHRQTILEATTSSGLSCCNCGGAVFPTQKNAQP